MIKQLLVIVLGGVGVALLVPLIAGCSSPGGCRTCLKGSERAAAVNPVVVTPGPPGAATAALPFGGQKTCPVTGEELGSMGKPVPVTLKGETVYVCCRGCAAKAQANPDKTLAAVAADRAR